MSVDSSLAKRRSRLINAARLAYDSRKDPVQLNEITLGFFADLGLRSVSPGKFDTALELFDQVIVIVAAFDEEDAQLGLAPEYEHGIELGSHPAWTPIMEILAQSVRDIGDYLLRFADKHGRLEVPLRVSQPAPGFTEGDAAFLQGLSDELVPR